MFYVSQVVWGFFFLQISQFAWMPKIWTKHNSAVMWVLCLNKAWFLLRYLDNQYYYCNWFLLMYNFQWCGITCNDQSKTKKWFVFKLRKLIEKTNKKRTGHWSKLWKSFQLFLMTKFWFRNRFLYFFS